MNFDYESTATYNFLDMNPTAIHNFVVTKVRQNRTKNIAQPSQNKITVGSNYNVTKVLKKCFLNQNYTTSPDRLVAESSPPELISFMFISNSDVRSLFSIGDITGSLLSSSL